MSQFQKKYVLLIEHSCTSYCPQICCPKSNITNYSSCRTENTYCTMGDTASLFGWNVTLRKGHCLCSWLYVSKGCLHTEAKHWCGSIAQGIMHMWTVQYMFLCVCSQWAWFCVCYCMMIYEFFNYKGISKHHCFFYGDTWTPLYNLITSVSSCNLHSSLLGWCPLSSL